MKTRKEYLNGVVTHSEYYSQFVTEATKNGVLSAFSVDDLKKAYEEDKHFNTIPLSEWDQLAYAINRKGTLAEKVCIVKEAARQLISM